MTLSLNRNYRSRDQLDKISVSLLFVSSCLSAVNSASCRLSLCMFSVWLIGFAICIYVEDLVYGEIRKN